MAPDIDLYTNNITNTLHELWKWECAVSGYTDGVVWWMWDTAPNMHGFWTSMLGYMWARTLGAPPDIRIDRCIAACAAGYLPVAFDGDEVVCFAMTPEELKKKTVRMRREFVKRAAAQRAAMEAEAAAAAAKPPPPPKPPVDPSKPPLFRIPGQRS